MNDNNNSCKLQVLLRPFSLREARRAVVPLLHAPHPHPKASLAKACLRGVELKAGQGMFGKADPYCRLRVGIQEFTTKHNPGGGKNPIWNEEFSFDISNERELEMEVLDKETVGNDKFMGSCKVSIMEWIASGRFEGDVDLLDKAGKNVGHVTLAVKFERPSGGGAKEGEGDGKDSKLAMTAGGVGAGAIGAGAEAARDP
eukprot:gene27341-35311_t